MTAISLKNININLSSTKIICNLSVDIDESEFISIVGPNGGGKSTLLKAILGLITPESGEISIFGSNIKKVDKHLIGYVPQLKTLERSFPAIPLELVASGILGTWPIRLNSELKDKSQSALEKVGAGDYSKKQLSRLSGGELQRVYLARCFVRNPKLLLLDEPNTGIDYASEMDLNNLIEEYRDSSKATIIVVTHDWEAAYHHADKVLLLNKTKICYAHPKEAFAAENLRLAFGHIGHKHEMHFAG
jgi:zinc transport system ATP-binding protein